MRTVLIAIAALFVAVGEPQAQGKDKLVIPEFIEGREEKPPSKPTAPWLTQEIEFQPGNWSKTVALAPGVVVKRFQCYNGYFKFTLVNRRQQPLPRFKLRIEFIDRDGDPTPRPFSKKVGGDPPRTAIDHTHDMSRPCREIARAVFKYNLM